jgi:hypothetical protein
MKTPMQHKTLQKSAPKIWKHCDGLGQIVYREFLHRNYTDF